MSSSMQTALSVVEILEQVLLQMDIRDLLRAASVNRHFRGVIEGSIMLQTKLWRRTINSDEDLPQPSVTLDQYPSFIELNPSLPGLKWAFDRRPIFNEIQLVRGCLAWAPGAPNILLEVHGPPREVKFSIFMSVMIGDDPLKKLDRLAAFIPAAVKAMYPLSCSLKGDITIHTHKARKGFRRPGPGAFGGRVFTAWNFARRGSGPHVTAKIETTLPTVDQTLAVMRMLIRNEPREPAKPPREIPMSTQDPTVTMTVPMASYPGDIGDIALAHPQYTFRWHHYY